MVQLLRFFNGCYSTTNNFVKIHLRSKQIHPKHESSIMYDFRATILHTRTAKKKSSDILVHNSIVESSLSLRPTCHTMVVYSGVRMHRTFTGCGISSSPSSCSGKRRSVARCGRHTREAQPGKTLTCCLVAILHVAAEEREEHIHRPVYLFTLHLAVDYFLLGLRLFAEESTLSNVR